MSHQFSTEWMLILQCSHVHKLGEHIVQSCCCQSSDELVHMTECGSPWVLTSLMKYCVQLMIDVNNSSNAHCSTLP